MTLVYILSGILLLGALSYLGIRREKQERQRFEREELARLEEAGRVDDPAPAVGDPEPLSIWDPFPTSAGVSVHLGANGRDPLLWRPLELPNPHLLIVRGSGSGSGSGKSQTLKAIAHELREACAVVILDLQRTFAPMGGSLQLGTLDGLLRQCYEARGVRSAVPAMTKSGRSTENRPGLFPTGKASTPFTAATELYFPSVLRQVLMDGCYTTCNKYFVEKETILSVIYTKVSDQT